MIKVIKIGLLFLAAIIMGLVIMLISDVAIVDALAGSFFIVINAYLGVDLASMIVSSAKLPKGEYTAISLHKYVISLVIMGVLFSLSIYRKEVAGVDAILAISSFGSGTLFVIGYIIGGLQGNKIATNSGEVK